MFGSLVAAITFLLFRWLLPFYFTTCFNRSFSPWFNCSSFSSQSLFDGVRLRLQKFPRIQWAIFVKGARVSKACVSLVGGMTQLTAALMRSDKLSKLKDAKTRALFLRGFPCFKRINRASRFDGFLRNLAKMFPGYQCAKVCEAFLIFQILLLLCALMWRRSANIQFANFKIDFLGNQSEYRKSLTCFCSLSPTDWHCAVCLVVRFSRKAGNSV